MDIIELWPNGPKIYNSAAAQPVSTDSVLLADFARPAKSLRGLDLGSGSGIISLLLICRCPTLHMTLCELSGEAAELSRRNLELNGLYPRAEILCRDLRELREAEVGRFDFIVTNPPYFPVTGGKSPDAVRSLARGEESCSLAELISAASALLGQGGRFYIVYPASRMAELISRLSGARLEPKRLRLVQGRLEAPPSLLLLEAAKLGRPGLSVEPALILKNADGTDTDEVKRIYHLGE